MNLLKVPFIGGMFDIFEAMHYSVSDYNKPAKDSSIEERERNEGWLKKIRPLALLWESELLEFKIEHEKELKENPLISAFIDLCLKVGKVSDIDSIKKLYDAYIDLQKEFKFEEHKKEYFDAGCKLATGYNEDKKEIDVMYPLYLYGAYTEHGGLDDDHRSGYLWPCHKLSKKELDELYKTNPELFTPKVLEVYKNSSKQRGE